MIAIEVDTRTVSAALAPPGRRGEDAPPRSRFPTPLRCS